MTEEQIIREVAARFPTFGGGARVVGNPIAAALSDSPPAFALGVDVAEVVRFIVSLQGDKT